MLGVEVQAIHDFQADASNVPAITEGFSHLVEDEGLGLFGSLYTNTDFVASADAAAAQNDGTGEYAVIHPTGEVQLQGAAVDTHLIGLSVDGEADYRFIQHADGSQHWGDGAVTPNVYQRLAVDPTEIVGGGLIIGPSVIFTEFPADPLGHPYLQAYNDSSFYAEDDTTGAYAGLTSDGKVELTQFLGLDGKVADPAAPSAGNARVYQRDNGAGKGQVCVRFPTGAVQVIATEP